MERYKNTNGNSGIAFFEIKSDSIIIQFTNNSAYLYNEAVTGSRHIKKMKELARSGKGLATYISKYVKNKYASQLN